MTPEVTARGILHGLPGLGEILYGIAGSITDWFDVGIPAFHGLLFVGLLYLSYFALSLPVRILEVLAFFPAGPERPGSVSSIARAVLELDRPAGLPKSLRIGLLIARLACFVIAWRAILLVKRVLF